MSSTVPGNELIASGIADLTAGVESVASLLVSIGHPRLCRIGIDVPAVPFDDAEHRLYRFLATSDPATAHSRYNSLIRRLVSFERAFECAS